MNNRVVITGMGVVSPNGTGIDKFEDALRQGRSGIRFIPKLEELKFGCWIGGVPQGIKEAYETYFKSVGRNFIEGNIEYALIAVAEAWRNAGLTLPDEDAVADWDTGTVFGCGVCDMDTISQKLVPMVNAGKTRRLGSMVVERVMGSGISAYIAGLLALGNQATSNSSACSTGTEAIIEAAWRIRTGLAKRMVAGGAEGSSPYAWSGFDSMRVLSTKFNQTPEKGSRPMSASACGFVPGAGAGALVLENLDTALERGARIYAEIKGGMINCGGQRQGGSMTAPNPEGVKRCIKGALADAKMGADEIDAVNGHLTATFADPREVRNWAEALGCNPADIPLINSTKSMIGHCLGAAGAIESVASVLELHKGFMHPSINCEDLHPDIVPYKDRIVQSFMETPELKTIAKASFGFGDVNSCLIMQKWER